MTSNDQGELRRSLGSGTATIIALGTILGSGIMILPGITYQVLGRAAWVPWAVAAVCVIPLLVAYSWLGRSYPAASGVAHYAQVAFGPSMGATSGLLAMFALITGIPATALTGGRYAAQFTGVASMEWVLPVLLVGLAVGVAVTGNNVSGRIQTVLTLSLCAIVVVVSVVALSLSPDAPKASLSLPLDSLALPLVAVFVAFTGWETVAFTFEEHSRPELIPRIFLVSYLIVTSIYALILFALFSSAEPDSPGVTDAPLMLVAQKALGSDVGRYIMVAFVVAAIMSNVLASTTALSRLVFGMARDHHLPRALSKVNVAGSPVRSVLTVGAVLLTVVVSVSSGLLKFEQLFVLSGGVYFILYGVGAGAFAVLNDRPIAKVVTVASLVSVVSVGVLAVSSLLASLALTLAVLFLVVLMKHCRIQRMRGSASG